MKEESSSEPEISMTSKTDWRSSQNLTLYITYLNVILYATCFQIQRPLEPFMVEKLQLTANSSGAYANLQSFFSIMQTVGSLVSGRFLDQFGVKGGFIISFAASALSYALLSQSTTLTILYISKIPTIFQAGFLCAQVAASQATADGAERVKALGLLTMSYTIGTIIGPTLGGYLGATGEYYLGAKIAVAGSLISIALTMCMPNPKVSPAPKNPSVDEKKMKETSEIPSFTSVFKLVWLYLGTKVITSVANAMASAAFPLVLKNIYHTNEQSMGLLMSLMASFNAVVNGVFLGPIVEAFGGNLPRLIEICIITMAVLSTIQGFVATPYAINASPLHRSGVIEFLALTFVLSIFQYVLSTTITSESTTRVGPLAKGTLLGLEHSVFAAARVIAPQTGVYLLNRGGVPAVCGGCAGVFYMVYISWKLCAKGFMENTAVGCIPSKTATERKEK